MLDMTIEVPDNFYNESPEKLEDVASAFLHAGNLFFDRGLDFLAAECFRMADEVRMVVRDKRIIEEETEINEMAEYAEYQMFTEFGLSIY